MAIASDSTSSGSFASGVAHTGETLAHTIVSATAVLIVLVYCQSFAITGCTYNGVAMTPLFADTQVGTGGHYRAFYINAPATGAHNIVSTYAGVSYSGIAARAFSGADITSAPEVIGSVATGSSTTPSTSVTPLSANSMLVSLIGDAAGSNAMTAGNGQTKLDVTAYTGAASLAASIGFLLVAGTGAQTLSWTIQNQAWAICGIALKPGGPIRIPRSPAHDSEMMLV